MKMFNVVLLVLLSQSSYGRIRHKSRGKTKHIPVEEPIIESPVKDIESALEKFREQVKDNVDVDIDVDEKELIEEVEDPIFAAPDFLSPELIEEVEDPMVGSPVKDPMVEAPAKDNEVEEEQLTEEGEIEKRSGCVDAWGNCKGYVDKGFCTHTHVQTMKTNCCASCKRSSGSSTSSECKDDNNQCGSWANRGECRNNPGYMLKRCKKSCSVCTGGDKKKKVDNGCKAKYTNCDDNAKKGYCDKYLSWMKENCCGVCKESATKAGSKAASGGKSGGGYKKGGKKQGCLASANSYRAKHRNTPMLEWDQDLADKAQVYAEELLRRGRANGGNVWQILEHDPENKVGEGMGENLWYEDWYEPGDNDPHYCRKADESWYDEIKDYSFGSGRGNGGVVTHFTQMVWVNSKKVGYGVAVGKSVKNPKTNKIAIVVAKYTPKGNWGNNAAFRKNVQYVK